MYLEINKWKKIRNTPFSKIWEVMFGDKQKDSYYDQMELRFNRDFFIFMTSLDDEILKSLSEFAESKV